MSTFKVIKHRKCCFCAVTGLRDDMCPVTSNFLERNKWGNLLGSAFILNAEKQKTPYICYSHFPPSKKEHPRNKKILPYLEGVPPVRTPKKDTQSSRGDQNDDSLVTSEEESEESEEEYDDYREVSKYSSHNTVFEHKRVLCDWISIFPYINKCQKCMMTGTIVEGIASIRTQGAVVLVNFFCRMCENKWDWASSTAMEKKNERGWNSYEVNIDIPGAIVFTGGGFAETQNLSQLLDIPFISESTYYRVLKSLINPVVNEYFDNHKSMVMERMIHSIDSGSPLHLAGDGQFDTRGYSAMLCRFSLMCLKSGLIIDFEVCRKNRGESSVLLEKQGHDVCLRRVLEKLKTEANPGMKIVETFTSDRCNNMSVVMSQFPEIRHQFDNWHFIRCIRKDITAKFNQKQFRPMVPWVRPFFAHLRTSISKANGDGNLAWEMIWSFFNHICGIHSSFQPTNECSFSVYQQCGHDPNIPQDKKTLDSSNTQHTKAMKVVKNVLLKGNRKEDLSSINPDFSTHSVESFHAVATKYTTKEKFFEKPSYTMRSKLAVLHWNNLKLDEEDGSRPVVRMVPMFCKTKKVVVWKKRKVPSSHHWRYELMEALRKKSGSFLSQAGSSESDTEPDIDDNDLHADEIDDEEVRIRTEVERLMYQL